MIGPIEIRTTIGVEDWVAYVLHDQSAYLGARRRRLARWIVGLLLSGPASLAVLTSLKLLVGHPWNGLFRGPDVLAWWVLAGGALGAVPYLLLALLMSGPLLGRRLTRWAIDEHGPDPKPVSYRLDAGGITTFDERSRGWLSWDRVVAIKEAPGAFYVVGRDRHVLPIPTRGVGDAEVQARRALASARPRGGGAPLALPTLPPWASESGAVIADFASSLDDEAASLLLIWSMPHPRRQRRRSLALLTLAFTVVPVALTTAAAALDWSRRPRGRSLAEAVLAFTDGGLWLLGAAAAGCAVGLLFVAADPLELRWRARSMARRARPTGEPIRIAVGPAGLAAARPGALWQGGWDTVRAARETSRHVGFVLELSVAIVLPKRALDAASLTTLRGLLAARARSDRG